MLETAVLANDAVGHPPFGGGSAVPGLLSSQEIFTLDLHPPWTSGADALGHDGHAGTIVDEGVDVT